MPEKNQPFTPATIDELGGEIVGGGTTGRYIFWLGAGVSVTAGVPLADGIVARLLDRQYRLSAGPDGSLKEYSGLPYHEQDQRRREVIEWATNTGKLSGAIDHRDLGTLYSHCFEAMLAGRVSRSEFIVKCLNEARRRLNPAVVLIAQLVRSGYVNTVLTTNFDGLVEASLELVGTKATDFPPNQISRLAVDPPYPQITHLHGREQEYDLLRNTHSELTGRIPGFKRFLKQVSLNRGLVVVGYRGGDEWPMQQLVELLSQSHTAPGRGLYWVSLGSDYSGLTKNVKNLLAHPGTRWLRGVDADEFFVQLCRVPGIGLGLPKTREFVSRLAPKVARAYSDRYREPHIFPLPVYRENGQSEAKLLDADRLLERGNETEAYAEYDAVFSSARNFDNATASFNYGVALAKLRRYDEAAEQLEASIKINRHDAEAHTVLGDCTQISGLYEGAIAKYRQVIDESPATPGNSIYKRALNNWGVALINLSRYSDAVQILRSALKIDPTNAVVLGNLSFALKGMGAKEGDALEREATRLDDPAPWEK